MNINSKTSKIFFFIAIALVFVSPIFFISLKEGKDTNEGKNDSFKINIGNDHYTIADDVVLSEKNFIGEDLFSISNNLIIDKRLKGNLFALGDLVTIKEDVLNDVKVVADKVVLSSSVYGSFITLNDSTYVEKGSFIEEDFVFIGKNLVFSGETQGNLVFIGNNITVTDTAKIGGKLTIKGNNKKISSDAYIGETVAFDEEIGKHTQNKNVESVLLDSIKILSIIAFGLLLGVVFNNRERWSLFGVLRNHPAGSVGFGVLSLFFFVPIIVLLFIINWFVGVVSLFAFLGLFAMSFVYLIVTVADIIHMIIKRDFNFSIYTALALLFVLFLLKIHLLLASILFLVWVFVLGASVIRVYSVVFRKQIQ